MKGTVGVHLVIKIFGKSEPQCNQACKIYGQVGKARGSSNAYGLV